MYSIIGLYHEEGFGLSIWSGYFTKEKESNEIIGQLIDKYGPSTLKGCLNKDTIEFSKTYNMEGIMINYKFDLQNNIWVGEYNLDGDSGKVLCDIKLFLKQSNLKKQYLTPEDQAHITLNKMIEEGYLKKE